MRRSAQRIDPPDARVRMRGTQQLAMGHSRQENVVREARLPGNLCASVHPASGHTDDTHFFFIVLRIFPAGLRQVFSIGHPYSRSPSVSRLAQNFRLFLAPRF
jgi:hypothetical protein